MANEKEGMLAGIEVGGASSQVLSRLRGAPARHQHQSHAAVALAVATSGPRELA